jgi:apolipoprotein N-acyltransferase
MGKTSKVCGSDFFWIITAVVMGSISALSFAPFNYSYSLIFTLLITFRSWEGVSNIKAAVRGYFFGLGYFGVGVSWVYISVHDYGKADVATASILTFLFVGFWSIFPAFTAYLTSKLLIIKDSYIPLLVFPFAWVSIEYIRGNIVLNGFPWLQISYSQLETPLAGFIPVFGSYGVSFLLALTASLLLYMTKKSNQFVMLIGGLIVLIWSVGHFLKTMEWTYEIGKPIKITVIQGNISQEQKWLPKNRDKTLRLYKTLTKRHGGSQVIIWPETAVPAFYHQVKDSFLAPLERWASNNQVDLVISIPEKGKNKEFYNSVMTFGNKNGVYRKIHLLPFGEYLPLQPLSGYLLKSLKIMPVGSFSAGNKNQDLLEAGGYAFITSICYEDVFGNKGLNKIGTAAYLVNVTNDAWFGDSFEPHQHMQMARMRAIESGRYLVRATNTGVTGFVTDTGELIKAAPMFKVATLTAEIVPRGGITPYNQYGDMPILLVIFVIAGLIFYTIYIQEHGKT